MIAAMRDTIDPFARSVREDYETNVEAPFAKGGEKIARALFAFCAALRCIRMQRESYVCRLARPRDR
jgi:hypothetical protein